MEFEFGKHCKIDLSPRTVLVPSHTQFKSRKSKPTSRNDGCEFLSLEEGGFTDNKLSNYPSLSPSEDVVFECNGAQESCREKIEFSFGNQNPFSLSILDSICGSDEEVEVKPSSLAGSDRNKAVRKSLLHEFSSALPNVVESAPQSATPCSPVHLKGHLKMDRKRGVPYFEFSMAHSEDVFVAKTWRAKDALNWVYTFHSIRGGKKKKYKYNNNKDFPMVGQMQVSCYLCSELRGCHGDSFTSSMVTEFVLYGIANARNIVENSKVFGDPNEGLVQGNVELDDLFALSKPKLLPNTIPRPPTDLHPNHEILAVVVQVPFEKRESLKHRRGEKPGNHLDQASLLDEKRMVKVNVLTPLGSHSLPLPRSSDEGRGRPSPLLDRWRVGGGCDCGGWDMACPLIVFANSNTQTQCMEEHSLLEHHQPLKLYVQGKKENMPALTITIRNKGQYSVDFHAQLSALQAFAVCVAILHTAEASSSAEQDKNIQLLQSSSLKVLVEDEVKVVVETLATKEKGKVAKRRGESNPTSFVVNPPFSPFARV